MNSTLSTIAAYIDTEVAAIKAKTDNLPADPADASDLAASFATVNATLATIAAYVDTEVAAIKAKTDNLPSDPADASDLAASFATVNATLATIAAYVDTEVAAIKAKTDNLPSDPADASDVAGAFATVNATLATIAAYVDTEVATILSKMGTPSVTLADDIATRASQTSVNTIDDLLDTEMPALTTAVGTVSTNVSAIQTILSGITSLANWLRRLARKDAGTAGMIAAEAEIDTGGTSTFSGLTDSLEAIYDASGGGGGGGLTAPQQAQLDAIEEHTALITSTTRITIAADSGSDIELKIGDDYAASIDTAKRIEITDTGSVIYDLLTDVTLLAVSFGFGVGPKRDLVTGTIDPDTITHTAASGAVPAYTTVFVECAVADTLTNIVGRYDVQITHSNGKKQTAFSGDCTLVNDWKS